MPALSIGALPDVSVIRDSWIRKTSLYQGGRVRARANNLISMEDPATEKRVYECQVDVLNGTDETALRAECPKGTGVAIGGDLPGGSFSGVVDIGDSTVFEMNVDGVAILLRALTLHIEEV